MNKGKKTADQEATKKEAACKKIAGRKTPLRTCVACGRNDAKNDLVRFVRNRDGFVACDASGRVSGRGAYLCASEACFEAAEKRGRLGSVLRCQLGSGDYRRLKEEFTNVCLKLGQTA